MFSRLLSLIRRRAPERPDQQVPHASASAEIYPAIGLLLDDLQRRSDAATSSTAREMIDGFRRLSPKAIQAELPHIYLRIEQAISHQDTFDVMRVEIRTAHPTLMKLPHFALIFESEFHQEVGLSVQYITRTIDDAYAMVGGTRDNILLTLKHWLQALPEQPTLPVPFSTQTVLPTNPDDWLDLLASVSLKYYRDMADLLGEKVVTRFFEQAYQTMAHLYGLMNTYPVVVHMMPDHILDQAKISLLNRRQIEQVLLDKLDALQKSHQELSQQNIELEQTYKNLVEARTAAVESMTQLKTVIDTVREGIMTIDADGRIVMVNREVLSIWGYDRAEELVGRNIDLLVSEEQKEHLINDMQTYLKTGRSAMIDQRVEITGLRRAGSFPLEVNMAETRMESDTLFTLAVQDITMRKKAEAERLKISKLESVSLIASGIAHDFNNIMTSVVGYISFARMYVEQGSPADEHLGEAEQAAREAGQLTSQLLSYSKNNTPLVQTLDVNLSAAEAVSFILHNTETTCTIEAADDLWDAIADPTQMTQVFHNLLVNADQAMDSRGSIRLQLDNITMDRPTMIQGVMLDPGPYVRMRFIDQGPGIPPEQLENIFDPYFTTKESGTGLGLTTVHTIMTQHRGAVAIDSTVGEGVTFTLFLPAALPETAEASATPIKDKILFMDHDIGPRTLAEQGLSQYGYEVTLVEGGDQAVSTYARELKAGRPYKAVVIDGSTNESEEADNVVQQILTLDSDAVFVGMFAPEDKGRISPGPPYCQCLFKPFRIQELANLLEGCIKISRGESPS